MRSGLLTSRRRPPPRTICALGTWTGPSCVRAASPMLLPPAGSGSQRRRSPGAESPAPMSPRSSLRCSTPRVPGTRRSSWSAETARSLRPCAAFPDHGAAAARLPGGGSLGGMGAEEHRAERGGPGDPEALADRLFRDMTGALELLTVYLGERLGLYQALHAGGPATSAELAARTGTTERDIREWLEHHAASGLLEVDDPATGPLARRHSLPPGHLPGLAATGDVRYPAFHGAEIVRAARWRPEVAAAFRRCGVPPPLPWAPERRPEFNPAAFLNPPAEQRPPGTADVDLRPRRE